MEKGDASPTRAAAGRLVDELIAGSPARRQRGVEIGDPETEMVNAGTVAFEEPGDRCSGFPRGEELDLDVAETDRHDGGAIGDFLGTGLEAKHLPVEGESLAQVGDGDADVSQARLRSGGHEP